MLRLAFSRVFRPFLTLVFAIGAIALLRDTRYQGQDFEVFWRAARAISSGLPVYDVARDGGMVFKYPPWILPAFIPFGWLSLSAAKWCWGLVELLSLYSVIRWLSARCLNSFLVYAVALGFWGLWAVHAMDGQVVLPILSLALWARGWRGTMGKLGPGVLFWSLSTKVFTLFPLASFFPWYGVRPKILPFLMRAFRVFLVLAALSLPALWVADGRSPSNLLASWRSAAMSGGQHLESAKIRGRDNQGFPALVMRITNTPANETETESRVTLWLTFFMAVSLLFFTRRLLCDENWVVWLAAVPVIHPLAWFHLFCFSFPLAAVAVDRCWAKGWVTRFVSIFGAALVALVTRKTAGSLGELLEYGSIKSWGVLLLIAVLIHVASENEYPGRPKAASPV